MNYQNRYNEYLELINLNLDKYLSEKFLDNKKMIEAMKYSVSAGGKRIRPILLLEFCRVLGADIKKAIPFACAVEFIHCCSLIHDDLPCMDDDDYRRGKLSCHKQFDEAIALLAGDALLTYAFNIMASDFSEVDVPAAISLRAIFELSNLAGVNGMIGGQVLDLENENKSINEKTLRNIHTLKTGALIVSSCKIGAIVAEASEEDIQKACDYALNLGLAFQIIDDILDVTSTTQELGKPVGSDASNNKSTYVTLLGLGKSMQYADEITKKSIEAISGFKDNEFLLELTKALLTRKK
jgi:geranylgeranyl diphosphate synthase type II